MSDASWFRLLVRAIGMLLIGLGLPMLLWTIGGLMLEISHDADPRPWAHIIARSPGLLGYFTQTALGFYLLHGGGAVTAWCIRRTLSEAGAGQG